MKNRRNQEDNTILLKENILEQQEQLHDVKVECFTEIQKMADKVMMVEKHGFLIPWVFHDGLKIYLSADTSRYILEISAIPSPPSSSRPCAGIRRATGGTARGSRS